MRFERTAEGYLVGDRLVSVDAVLDAVMEADDSLGGQVVLPEEVDGQLQELFKGRHGLPDFSTVSFMEASSALFSYLAASQDRELASLVADSMGWLDAQSEARRIEGLGEASASYRAWWASYAQEVLSYEGFDDYHFGSVHHDGSGTYLYNDEKAVCYVEVSRDGGDERHAVISLTLLGNPEAVEDEEGERAFEWCCWFDDEISRTDDDAHLLGGHLRTIDPYGASSRLQRRYDVAYDAVTPSQLGLVTRSLVHLLESRPPTC